MFYIIINVGTNVLDFSNGIYTVLYFSLNLILCFHCGMKFIIDILTNIVEFIVDVCIQVYRNES